MQRVPNQESQMPRTLELTRRENERDRPMRGGRQQDEDMEPRVSKKDEN